MISFQAHIFSYADDFVILSRGCGAEVLMWVTVVMSKLGLSINEAKTSIRDARKERSTSSAKRSAHTASRRTASGISARAPSKKSIQRFKTKVCELLVPANVKPWDEVSAQLNSMLSAWSGYFSHGTTTIPCRQVDWHVYQRVRDLLARRHKARGRGKVRFSIERVYGELGLIRHEKLPPPKSAVGLQ